MRIYELAKELKISNNELKDILKDKLNIEISSHMNAISDKDVNSVKNIMKAKGVKNPKVAKNSLNQAETKKTINSKSANNTNGKPVTSANRSTNNKPAANTNRPLNNKPAANTNRPANKKSANNTNKPANNRPSNSANRSANNRPSTSANRPANSRPTNSANRSTNNRPTTGKPSTSKSNNSRFNTTNNRNNNQSKKSTEQGNKNNRAKVLSGISTKNNRNKNTSKNTSMKANNNYFANKKKRTKKKYNTKREVVEKKLSISMPDTIILRDLAEMLNMSSSELISKLIPLGFMVSMNQALDFETVELLAEEFNFDLEHEAIVEELNAIEEEIDFDFEDDPKDLVARPPIVTVMGHVDHGKTSLLDAIRNTVVTEGEAGGITQHIGASQVMINGKKITFLDTPGHEAFTSMRARGASVTDISVLVVAADDGVMPQTIEAIDHSKAAGVPIIVAINKIDKPGADPSRVIQELAKNGVVSEDWGGDTIMVEVSAKKGTGIEDLLEMILLQADVLELKANPNRKAVGAIIEARLDKGKGAVASVLVQKGTLRKGDYVLVGSTSGKIRAMFNNHGKRIGIAGPSVAVEIIGLNDTPLAGDILYAMDDEKQAKIVADKRKEKERQENMNKTAKVSLDDLYDKIKKGVVKDFNIILKCDVRGSIEAIKQSLNKLSLDEVKVKVVHASVGGVNENDVNLAIATDSIIIGFNVRPSVLALEMAKQEGVDVRTYNIIYSLLEDIEHAVKGLLAPEFKEVALGRAQIRQTFKVPNVGIIAGVYVTSGKITRKANIRILRDNIIVHDGEIISLKRFKDDVSELNINFEGGVGIANFQDIRVGDVIEAYIMEEIKRK